MTNLEEAILASVDAEILGQKIKEISPDMVAKYLADRIVEAMYNPNTKFAQSFRSQITIIMKSATEKASDKVAERIEQETFNA